MTFTSAVDLMEYKLSGGFNSNSFTTTVSIGTRSGSGGPVMSFVLLLVDFGIFYHK